MKLSCTQENLERGLATVVHLAGRNVTLPILNNVLLKTENGVIQLMTTNLEMGVRATLRGKVEEEGSFTVQARLFMDYVGLLPNDRVDIEVSENLMRIVGGGNETTMKGLTADEFPLLPSIEQQNGIEVDLHTFRDAVTETLFAAALDDTRPEISGVYCVVANQTFTCVGTDSYRLAERIIPLHKAFSGEARWILPLRTLQELLRILSQAEAGTLQIFWSENQIAFLWDDVEFISRLVEGQYPDYQQIIPKDFRTEAIVSRDDLIKTVKTASLFAKSGINDVALQLSAKENMLIVSSANQQVGENVSRLKSIIKGDDNTIVFNYRYLLEGLASFETDEVKLQVIDSDNPGLFRPNSDDKHIYLVMPIKK
ncbi:MAG: DNA polymerase III subunit beta [Candidatus Kerfeldbacteria bacterium]|nr:DNA polymerase III subunit beta [Candidatus Kerfeldbacteria bacterium]